MTLGLENSYSVRDAAMAASAFAITASARSIAARSSSFFQISTEWPSSSDSSVASCVRESNSRSAAMASQSSLMSAPFREDWVITPSHRSFGTSCNGVTTHDNCNYPRSHIHRLAIVWLCSGGASGESRGAPVPRQKPVDHALQHVAQVCVRLDVVELALCNERTEDRPSLPIAIALAEEIVLASERHRSDRADDGIRFKFDAVLMEEAGQSIPAQQCITDRFSAPAGQLRKLHLQLEAKAVNDRLGECAPHRQPMRRRLTTQLRFDGTETSDAPQGLVRDRHVLGLRNVIELVPGVRPTRGEDDVSGAGRPIECRVSIDVQNALEVRQMRSRALRLPVGREHINCSRRIRSSQAPLIVGIHPQPSRLGAPSARGRERRTAWTALFTNLMKSMRRSKCRRRNAWTPPGECDRKRGVWKRLRVVDAGSLSWLKCEESKKSVGMS